MTFSITIQATYYEKHSTVVIDQLDTIFEEPTTRIEALQLVHSALVAAQDVDPTQEVSQ